MLIANTAKAKAKAVVVFDGYQGSTIKDMTHKRRRKGKHGMTVTFEKNMNLTVTKEVFLSNTENKQRFIIMLGEQLSKSDCMVFHDTGDADCLIVKKAMVSAAENKVVLVGDDTDLLVLLLHQQYEGKHDVFFAPEPKKNSKARIWDVKDVKERLGSFICKHILFIHAMLGCDSTSRVFGLGKGVLL